MDFSSIEVGPEWVYYPSALLLVALCVLAWFTSVFTLPGNWFVVALAAGFAWLFPEDAGRGIGWITVGAAAAFAVLGEVIEFAAGAAGAAKQGASKRAVVLSLVGAIAGSIAGVMVGTPVPVVGSFVMAILGGAGGAFAGAYFGEMWKGREEDARVAAGQGAFVGKIWGTLGKLACGAVGVAIITVSAFF